MISSFLTTVLSALTLYVINQPATHDMCMISPPTYFATPTFSMSPVPGPVATNKSLEHYWLIPSRNYSASTPVKNPDTFTKATIIFGYLIMVLSLTHLNLP